MNEWAPELPAEIRSELPPFGIKPHWVTFSFSSRANHLYDLLNAYVSTDRGDRKVWPALDTIAPLMGLSRGDKVSPYMRELEAGGALDVEHLTKTGGNGQRYVITLRLHPPASYTGPMQTSDLRKNTHNRRSEPAPLDGGNVAPAERGDVAPPHGGVTNNQGNQNHQNHTAPDGRVSAPDDRRSTTGTPRASAARAAAPRPPKSTRSSSAQVAARRAVLAALPAELWNPAAVTAPLPKDCTRVPVLRDLVDDQLTRRDVTQLIARIERRWLAHGWDAKRIAAVDGVGPKLDRGVGVAVALLREPECTDPRCEDGTDVDAGGACRSCERDRPDRKRTGTGVPAARSGPDRWECRDCRDPKTGPRPDDGVCGECRRAGDAFRAVVAGAEL